MKINQYEFLRNGKPFEPTREEIIQFAEHELKEKDKEIKRLSKRLSENGKRDGETIDYLRKERDNARHQVCKEIRDVFHSGFYLIPTDDGWCITDEDFEKILKMIGGE